MEKIIKLHIEKLPEGVFLATSDDIQGLIAQGRTVMETIEIARDVAKKLLEAKSQRQENISLPNVSQQFDFPIVVGI
jgi:predicted RNase H-like HicB family nuclease